MTTVGRRGRLRLVAAAAAVALLAAGCGSGSGGKAGSGKIIEGGTFRLGTSSGIDSLNPYVAF